MKILNEQQQLQKRIDELWTMHKLHSADIDIQKRKVGQYKNRWLKNIDKINSMRYKLDQMELIEEAISEYIRDLRDRLNSLNENQKQ